MGFIIFFVLVLLISINALYVVAEFAAVGVRHSRIRQLAQEGHRAAARLWTYLEHSQGLDRYIAACQVGITISSLVLGAYGQAALPPLMAPLFEQVGGWEETAAYSVSAVIVLLGLTAVQMVFGELAPKSVALQYPTQAALRTVWPMQWSLRLLSGFITVLNGSGTLLLKLFGVPQTSHHHIHSPEEIGLIIAESRDGGLLEPDEQHRLHRALQVGMRASNQLMTPRLDMYAVDADLPLEELLERIRGSGFTRLPVYKGSLDNVIGLLHTKDVLAYYLDHGEIPAVEAVMRPIMAVYEKVKGDRLLHLMRRRRSRQAVVVDEYGGVSGFVTIEEILNKVFDPQWSAPHLKAARAEPLPDGRIRLPGAMRLDDLEFILGVKWTGTAQTVGGRILDALGYLPTPGEHIEIDGIPVQVERVHNRKIVSIVVAPTGESAGEAPT